MCMKKLLIPTLVLCFGAIAQAAPISSGNLVVYRVGDGVAALGTAASSVFLDEYTITGTLVQSIALPNSGAAALTAVGNSTTEGVISRSQDGSSLVFTGYRAAAATASPTASTVNRVVGTIDFAGLANTSVALTDVTSGNIRSATSVDGTSSFYLGVSTGVRYVGSPSGAATSVLIDNRNSRQVNLSGNTLFAANGSTAIAGKVQTYGTLPTTATAAIPAVSLALADAVNGFAMFDLDASVAGDDTMYLLSTVENLLRKYTFDGTTWLASGSVSAGGALNLTGTANGGTVDLFLTTSSAILSKTDVSGYNSTITAGGLTSVVTAGANTGFRGIGILVPEPTALSLGLIALGAAGFRRRKA